MSEHPIRVKCVFEMEVDGEVGVGSSERKYPANTNLSATDDSADVTLLAAPIVHALRAAEVQVPLILAEALIQALQPNSLDGDVRLNASLDKEEATLLAAVVNYRDKSISESDVQ